MVDTFKTTEGKFLEFKTRGNQVKINDIWYLRSDGERVLAANGIKATLQPIKRRKVITKSNWR